MQELTGFREEMEKKNKFNTGMNNTLKRIDTGENKVQKSEMQINNIFKRF